MSANTGNGSMITIASYPRAIVHIDADAFFASCEQAKDPALKGRPVVTGKERGIIACASYEAKALGIRRGIGLRDAKRICPGLIVLPSDYETYSIYSERIFEVIRSFTPVVEEFSIDEAFCDITGLRRFYRMSYEEIAAMIRERINCELGITVSAGLSLTKSLAKICSRHRKPDGLTALPGNKIHVFLKDVLLKEVCGFGPNTVEVLNKCGLRTVLDYIERPLRFAESMLGKVGRELWHELRGERVYIVSTEKADRPLSISKTKTFSPPSGDGDLIKAHLMRNMESAFIKLRRHGLSAKSLDVYLRTSDFDGSGLRGELDRHSSSTLDFTGLCGELFDMAFRKGVSYRATGVVLSDIMAEGEDSRTLFDDPVKIAGISDISKAVDKINSSYGKYTVHLAVTNPALLRKIDHPRGDEAWRKRALLKGETFRKRLKIPLLKTLS